MMARRMTDARKHKSPARRCSENSGCVRSRDALSAASGSAAHRQPCPSDVAHDFPAATVQQAEQGIVASPA